VSIISETISNVKKQSRSAFIPYFILGLPDIQKSVELIVSCKDHYDILELGIPFTDPIADGPTIQEGSIIALKNKYSMEDFFKATKEITDRTKKPVVYMLYYNQVFGYGTEKFMQNAQLSGVNGIIVPDLLPESDPDYNKFAEKYGIDTIFLVTPLTKEERIKMILKYCKGFLYLTAIVGITGERKDLNRELADLTKKIRNNCEIPVCIGFGISTPEQVKEVSDFADGVIVGSAIVKKVIDNASPIDFTKLLFNGLKK